MKITKEYLGLFQQFARMTCKMDFFEVSRSELILLLVVAERNENKETVGVREVADLMQVSSPAISRMVRSLAEEGFLEKKNNPQDKRNTQLFITPKGMEALQACEKQMTRIGNAVMEIIGEEKAASFAKMCGEFLDVLEQAVNDEREFIQKSTKNS